jgi:hypothetical protein
VVAAGIFAFGGGDGDPQVVTTDPQVTVPPTTVPPTTVPPTTTPPTTAPVTEPQTATDPATVAVDRLIEVYNARDAAGIEAFFGDSVAFNTQAGLEGVGAEVSEGWQQVFGSTLERLTASYRTPDGLFVFLVDSVPPAGRNDLSVYELEMDGDRLVRLNNRIFTADEQLAQNTVDDVLEAFTDQDLTALEAFFGEDVVYTSPSNVDFVGPQAADRWAGAFGETALRTTGVFDLGDGTFGFDVDWIEPDSGRANKGTVVIEMADGAITSWVDDWDRG